MELCAQLSYASPGRYTVGISVSWKGFLMPEQTGLEIAREKMVDSQVRPNSVNDERVIAAMRALPREDFAPAGTLAYSDADLPLGNGRYLLKPMVTARLAQLALAGNPAHALVIGAGSGYLAAILALAGLHVVALEEDTRLRTAAILPADVVAVFGKLAAGWPASGPYDVIVIEGAVTEIPASLAQQLSPAGRVVGILSPAAEDGGLGRAVVAQAADGGFTSVPVFDCTARPLPELRRAPEFVF
jgi:protein-L-isoaspartate(D-aspartate) O-methyltransferase